MKRVVLAATIAIAIAPGCSGDFDPGSRVTSLRVLAVQADAPYASPGQAVHLEALAFDPTGRTITWGWGACVDPASGSATACIDAMRGSPFVISANRTANDVTIPADALSSVPLAGRARASVGVVTVACPGDLAYDEGAPSIESSGRLPFTCRDASNGRVLGVEEYVAGVKRIFVRATDKNANPSIARLTWDGVDWPETEVKTAVPCPTSGHRYGDCDGGLRHTVAAIVPSGDAETGVDSFGTPFEESTIVQYYATEGIFEHDVRIASDPATGWVPRSAAAGQMVRMWFVVHDNRGGVSWVERQVQVTTP